MALDQNIKIVAFTFKGALRLTAALPILAFSLGAVSAHAASQGSSQATVQVAQAANTYSYNISAGELSDVLNRFADQSDIELIYPANIVNGFASNGLSGTYSPKEALGILLKGTGLNYKFTEPKTVTISDQLQSSSNKQLDEIQVEADAPLETPWGSFDGYVAKRSLSGAKTDTPLNEMIQSVSVITNEQMKERGAQTLSEALRYTSGVEPEVYGSETRYDTYFIRGYSAQVLGRTRDGLSTRGGNWSFLRYDPYILERLEVLRGPSSALYGDGSPGGLVNSVSKRPSDEPINEVIASYGSYGKKQIQADFSNKLYDRLLFRVTALARESGTHIPNTKDDRLLFAPSLTWLASDDTTLTLTAQIQNDDADSIASFLPHRGTVSPANSGHIPRNLFIGDPDFEKFDKEQNSIGYLLQHKFSDQIEFRQNARYSLVDLDYNTIYAQGAMPDYGFPGTTDDLVRVPSIIKEDLKQFAVDNQLELNFKTGDVTHKFLTGVDATVSNIENDQWGATTAAAQAFTLANAFNWTNPSYSNTFTAAMLPKSKDETTDRRKIGLYVQDQLKFDNWTVTGGLRHDWAKQDVKNNMTGTEQNQDDTALTGRMGLTYKFDNGVSPYANFATSFTQLSGTDVNGKLFDPEEGQQFEVGVRYQDPVDPILLSASVFQITRQNVLATDPNNAANRIQVGEVRNRGLELEGQMELSQGLNLITAYTLMDSEITDDPANKGKTPAAVPTHTAKLWTNYSFAPASDFAGLTVGGGVRYRSSTKANNANTLSVPGFGIFDAKIGYELTENAELTINATNLFDKNYVAACSSTNNCFYGDPRKITASVKITW